MDPSEECAASAELRGRHRTPKPDTPAVAVTVPLLTGSRKSYHLSFLLSLLNIPTILWFKVHSYAADISVFIKRPNMPGNNVSMLYCYCLVFTPCRTNRTAAEID